MKSKRYVNSGVKAKNPIKLRVVNKQLQELDDCVGRCWIGIRRIEIDPRQCPKEYMDTLIHETLHQLLPKKREDFILRAGTTISNLLWRLGYRQVKKHH